MQYHPAPDFRDLLASISRCNAVYEDDDAAARAKFAALGSSVKGRFCNLKHQAIAHIDPQGRARITLSGSRVTTGPLKYAAGDLFEDIDFSPTDVAGGKVAAGALDGLEEVFNWGLAILGQMDQIYVEGHSLGGQRAHLAPLFIAPERLGGCIAWEPPKAADDAFYNTHAACFAKTLTVVHGRDPWAAWPWIEGTLRHPPAQPMIWLTEGGWKFVDRDGWSGGDIFDGSDHDTETVLAAVKALAG